MHILIIPSWYPSTPNDVMGSFFREQAQALVRAGCKVGVIFPQLRSLRQLRSAVQGRYGVTNESDGGVFTLRYHGIAWFPRMPKLHFLQWAGCGRDLFDEYVSRHGTPDVIHAHSALYAGCLARQLWLRYGVPYVMTEHSSSYARDMLGATQLRMAVGAVQMAKSAFAVSDIFCQLLASVLPETKGRWKVVPNMVHHDFLEHKLVVNEDAGKQFSFLHVSALNSNKAVDLLLKAFASSFRGDKNTTLKIGGDGSDRSQLERLARALEIGGQVRFLGSLSRESVLEQMASCDAFVLCSRYETFGVVLIEAMALGKPVVATRCGGPESIVREQDGVLVPAGNVERMAEAMKSIRENIGDYDSYEIRRGCSVRFSERAVVERLMHEYAEICGQRSRREMTPA